MCYAAPDASGTDAASPTFRVAAALRSLASRGAYVDLGHEAPAELAVVRGSRTGAKPRPISLTNFQHAQRFGWVVCESAESTRWRLSASGLEAIRRAKSEPPARGNDTPPKHGDGRNGLAPAVDPRIDRPGYDPDESPLAWLRRRKDKAGKPLISGDEFTAGERLRADFQRAQMSPRTTADWASFALGAQPRNSAVRGGAEISDSAAAAQSRVQRALASVGPDLSGILVDACCHLKTLATIERERGLAQRSGKEVLRLAVRSLARHYGYGAGGDGAGQAPQERPTHIRHWGADDYRPNLDSWQK